MTKQCLPTTEAKSRDKVVQIEARGKFEIEGREEDNRRRCEWSLMEDNGS